MGYSIINKISGKYVPKWGNAKKYIVVHYLGVDGQNYELSPDGVGAHFTIYWDGSIYQRCDLNAIVWAVGTAGVYTQKHPEARNSNSISIELCCHCDGNKNDANDPKWWFTEKTQNAAVWLVQKLMRELDIPIDHVLRHYDVVNKICPAPYVKNNRYRESWTWEEFKQRVMYDRKDLQWYRIRKSWNNPDSQVGAYMDPDSAKLKCPPGYSVFDSSGKKIYHLGYKGKHTHEFFDGMDERSRAEAAFAIIKKTDNSGICWSVTAAQWVLESFYGRTDLAVNAENYFGMKCNLSNNTWESVWDGKSSYIKDTKEQDIYGKEYTVTAAFRKYTCLEDSIKDHAGYLLGAMNGDKKRYEGLTSLTTAEEQIKCIKNGGYATDVHYVDKILDIIRRYNLDAYDSKVKHPEPEPVKDIYRVRKAWLDSVSQVGAFYDLENAIACCNENPGYRVYDQFGNELYALADTGLPYTIRITSDQLINIHSQPSKKSSVVGIITPGVYTIVSERKEAGTVWGELKSGIGWIPVDKK